MAWQAKGYTLAAGNIAFALAARGYDPQRGVLGTKNQELKDASL
jgi:hypothetical protein